MELQPERYFLGWHQPPLGLISDWLLNPAHLPEVPDLSQYVVVVSSARIARGLEQKLAEKAPRGDLLAPPRIVTPFQAAESMFKDSTPPRKPASLTISRMAWEQAIRRLSRESLGQLFGPHPPLDQTTGEFPALAAKVCQELASHGFSPADVAEKLPAHPEIPPATRERWLALQEALELYEQTLGDWDLIDATTQTNHLLLHGLPTLHYPVILAGVTDFSPVFLKGLGRLPATPKILLYAPENEANHFDPWGRVKPEDWANRAVPIRANQIYSVATSSDQAELIARFLASAPFSAASFVLGLPDSSEIPTIVQALKQQNLAGRPVPEKTIAESRLWQFLRLTGDLGKNLKKQHPSFTAVASWIRQPDAIRYLGNRDYSTLFDRWQQRHLPTAFAPGLYSEFQEDRGQRSRELIHRLHSAGINLVETNDLTKLREQITEVLSQNLAPELWSAAQDLRSYCGELQDLAELQKVALALSKLLPPALKETPVSELAVTLSQLLDQIYGALELNEHAPEQRVLWTALATLARELATLQQLPPHIQTTFVGLLDGLLRELGSTGVPAPIQPGSIDLVGFLELLADEAPLAIIASCCEGFIPESITSDPFLPGNLRARLEMNDNRLRLARDAYLLTALIESRPNGLWIIVPRRNAQGEPLKPSRLLLNGLEGEALARRILGLSESLPSFSPEQDEIVVPALQPPRPPPQRRATLDLRVTAFRDYQASPRRFYYQHILGLKTVEPELGEMNPLIYGNLLHELLSRFGQSSIRHTAQADQLDTWLQRELKILAHLYFADLTGPAVRFQLEEMQERLRGFAQEQAAETADGWQIAYAENQGADEVLRAPLVLSDGRQITLKGRIDRLDYHRAERRWRIVDYKTSNRAETPIETHRGGRGGQEWKDFQLPLYSLLFPCLKPKITPEFSLPGSLPSLHYFLLPSEISEIGLSPEFPPDQIGACLEEARRLGQLILDGEFGESGRIDPREDPALRALCGEVGWTSEEEEEDVR